MRIKLLNIFTISVSNKRVNGVHFSLYFIQIHEIRAQEILIEIIFTIQNWSFSNENFSETNCTKEFKKKFSIIINSMLFCIANVLHNYTTNA